MWHGGGYACLMLQLVVALQQDWQNQAHVWGWQRGYSGVGSGVAFVQQQAQLVMGLVRRFCQGRLPVPAAQTGV